MVEGQRLCEVEAPEGRHDALELRLGKQRLFRHVSRAFKLNLVAVRVLYRCDPHGISHERTLGLNPARRDLTVDGQSVVALEADGDSHAKFTLRLSRVWVMVFLELLQHQGSVANLQPAPANFVRAIGRPLFGHHKAQAIHIKTKRCLHTGHAKKGHSLLYVCCSFHRSTHFGFLSFSLNITEVSPRNTRIADLLPRLCPKWADGSRLLVR